jgi:uncharacterized protein (DUF849 family)
MALDDPVIITCAISGALANRDQCPAIPYTPAEYAAEARRIADEGGVMIHIHARRPDGTPSHAVDDYRAITDAIRAEVGDAVIVNYSTGAVGVPVETRVAYLRALRPEVAALNMGSMNYAKYSPRRVGLEDNLYLPDGAMARSNGDLVAKARQMTLDVGRRPATVAEARALLGLDARPAGAAASEAVRE